MGKGNGARPRPGVRALCKRGPLAYTPAMRQFAASKDTIAAVATPLGRGGVGIVRVSGPGARELGALLFESAREGFAGLRPYRLHHGWVRDEAGGSSASRRRGSPGR